MALVLLTSVYICLLQEGKLQEAIESLLSLEKQTRTVSQMYFCGLLQPVYHPFYLAVEESYTWIAESQIRIFCVHWYSSNDLTIFEPISQYAAKLTCTLQI